MSAYTVAERHARRAVAVLGHGTRPTPRAKNLSVPVFNDLGTRHWLKRDVEASQS